MKEQIVVTGGYVVASHKFDEDIYDLYPHDGTVAWFDYTEVLDTEVTRVETVSTKIIGEGVDPISISTDVTKRGRNPTIPDPRLAMTLPDAKAAVISMLRRIAAHEIQAQYPVQTQILLERLAPPYTTTNRDDARTFIDGRNAAMNTKIAAVNALSTVPAVIAYNVWA